MDEGREGERKRGKDKGRKGRREEGREEGIQVDLLYCIFIKNKKNKLGFREVFLYLCLQNYYSSYEMEVNLGVF